MPDNDQKGQIDLRPMTLEDLEQVVAIDRASFPSPWPKDAFLYEIKRQQNAICWVAEINKVSGGKGILVASIVIWLIVDEAHIGTLAVKPGYRRQKIAQELLACSLIEAYQRGAQRAMLEVRESNQGAQNLYRKFGFEPVGLRRDYYKDTHEDAILMTLEKLDPQHLARLAEGG
jgi:ribosomal-protein-alanine N-acetyltransferase